MAVLQAVMAACVLGFGQAPATPAAPAAEPSAMTVAVEAGKAVKAGVCAPPYGGRPKERPLLRVATAKFDYAAGQPATVTLEGSVVTAAKVDYRITVTLLAEGGRAVAATSTVEHVEHVELGKVLTVLRTWKLDFGKGGGLDRVKAMEIRVVQLGAAQAVLSPQEAADRGISATVTVEMDVVRTGGTDSLKRAGEEPEGPILLDPELRLRDGARFRAVLSGSAIREWVAERQSGAGGAEVAARSLDSALRGHRVRLTGYLTRDPLAGGAAGPAPWTLIVDRGAGFQIVK